METQEREMVSFIHDSLMRDINRVILEDIYETVKISIGRNMPCDVYMSEDSVYAISNVYGMKEPKKELINLNTYLAMDGEDVFVKIDIKSDEMEFSQEFRSLNLDTLGRLAEEVITVGRYSILSSLRLNKKTFEYYDMKSFRETLKERIQWNTVTLTDKIMHNFIEKRNTEFFTGYRSNVKGGRLL